MNLKESKESYRGGFGWEERNDVKYVIKNVKF